MKGKSVLKNIKKKFSSLKKKMTNNKPNIKHDQDNDDRTILFQKEGCLMLITSLELEDNVMPDFLQK